MLVPADILRRLRLRAFSSLAVVCLLSGATSAQAATSTISISGRQLLVNCAPYLMRGVNYSPAAIGQGTGGFNWYSNSALLAQDVASMKAMGVNTVRVYLDYAAVWNNSGGDPNNDTATNPTVVNAVNAALDTLLANGIRTIVNVWLPYNEALMSAPNPRSWEKLKFRKLIHVFKSNPGVLMWVLGNENNAGFNRTVTAPQLFAFIQEAVSEAKSIEAPPQPISVVLVQTASDGVTQDHLNASLLNAAPAVDLWGLNLYQSPAGYTQALDPYNDPRPLFISEFGQDVWNSSSNAVDAASQASFYQSRWTGSIGPRLSAINGAQKLVGACAFEWNDEWYKDPAGAWGSHDNGGFALSNDNDNYSNEEWFGLTAALATGVNGPRSTRSAYSILQSLWTAAPYNSAVPASCCPSCSATPTATRTATPDPCLPTSFDDFEALSMTNAWGGTWGAAQQDNATYATEATGSYSGGGLTYGFNTVGNWSVLYSPLGASADPAANGGAGAGAIDLSGWGQVRFRVKASVPGTYYFGVASNLGLSPSNAWYRAPFSVGSGWSEVVLNLDASSFSNPGGNYGSWQQNIQAATQFTILPPANVSGTLNLDEVRLTRWCGVPTATASPTPFGTATVTPNPCLPQTLHDFENGSAVNAWGGAWNQSQQTGSGSIAVGAGGQSGQGLSWSFNTSAGWAVLFSGLNPGADPAGSGGAGTGARALSAYGRLSFWVKASAAGDYVFKLASNTNDSPDYSWYQAPFSVDSGWTQVRLDLTDAVFSNPGNNTASFAQTLSRATQIVFQAPASSTATLQIDGVVLSPWCGLPSPTPSVSPTRSASPTLTPSPTAAKSPSATATSTRSATRTSTRSASPSMSPSASPTVTPSHSPTTTPTRTSTSTDTSSPSPSRTWSPVPLGSTLTPTPTPSPSFSVSPTHSPTASPSVTATVTATLTPSATASMTPSQTPSATRTSSVTATPSVSPSLTVSLTATQSPSATLSPSPTLSPTLSPSPIWTSTLTAIPTVLRPQDGDGSNRADKVVPFPNPNPRSWVVHLQGEADTLHLKVFSAAMTLVWREQRSAPFKAGWNHLPLGSEVNALPNGLYFVQVQPSRAGQVGFAAPITRMLLMR